MTKRDIFPLKLAIEADAKLSHGAARLGLLICSYIYNHPQSRFAPDEPFPMPWTLCSKLCFGMSRREVYRCHRELHDRGHILHCGVSGCPATASYKLNLLPSSGAQAGTTRSAQAGTTRSANCDTTSGAKKVPASGAKKSTPQISSSFQEEIVNQMEGNHASGGSNGSLRSKGTKGESMAGLPAVQTLTAAQRREAWARALAAGGHPPEKTKPLLGRDSDESVCAPHELKPLSRQNPRRSEKVTASAVRKVQK